MEKTFLKKYMPIMFLWVFVCAVIAALVESVVEKLGLVGSNVFIGLTLIAIAILSCLRVMCDLLKNKSFRLFVFSFLASIYSAYYQIFGGFYAMILFAFFCIFAAISLCVIALNCRDDVEKDA